MTAHYAGRRATPHLFRDIFAVKYLEERPEDYLTLSKILWHRNIQNTLRIYGARFDESLRRSAGRGVAGGVRVMAGRERRSGWRWGAGQAIYSPLVTEGFDLAGSDGSGGVASECGRTSAGRALGTWIQAKVYAERSGGLAPEGRQWRGTSASYRRCRENHLLSVVLPPGCAGATFRPPCPTPTHTGSTL